MLIIVSLGVIGYMYISMRAFKKRIEESGRKESRRRRLKRYLARGL